MSNTLGWLVVALIAAMDVLIIAGELPGALFCSLVVNGVLLMVLGPKGMR